MGDDENGPLVRINDSDVQSDFMDIRNMIHLIRGKQVIIDTDLASLYGVETKALNRAVRRNIGRFPEDFCFQLTSEEYDNLRYQFGTSSSSSQDALKSHGGRRYLPFVFTEQGVSMLSAVVHTDIAVNACINIMRAFVEMRRFFANNALMFEKISGIELKQLEFQKDTDRRFDEIYEKLSEHAESTQKIFFDGQIYDAFSFIVNLIGKADRSIVLIDGYVDMETLDLLSKKKNGIEVTVYTKSNSRLNPKDVDRFNDQYGGLTVEFNETFHDRFLILDSHIAYHIGASIKDAGKKCFAISLLEDDTLVTDLMSRL